MAFKFPLATVLRVRLIREQREERLLQQVLFQIRQTMAQMAAVDAELERVGVQRAEHVFQPMAAHQLHGSYSELGYLRQKRKELESALAQLEDAKDKQRASYEAARRDRKMLTEMRERQHSVFQFDADKREQRKVDEYFSFLKSRPAN